MSFRKRTWTTRGGAANRVGSDYVDPEHGKRHIETFQRKKEADAREARGQSRCRQGHHRAEREHYRCRGGGKALDRRRKADGRERSTLRQYETHVRLHIAPVSAGPIG